ncbi:MAG: hypothetical protein JWN62_3337 [Acidimicrobiales bacterium]|nr:hypothetical protein [Acidimicrobiales bacterium]
MRPMKCSSARKVAQRIAPIACVAMLGVVGVGCGSTAKPANGNTPPAVTTPSSATTPATTSPPQSGGAGF